jgi:hypothetical protein
MYDIPTAPLPIGGVLDNAIKLYRASFRGCWPIALLGTLVSAAAGIYITLYLRRAGINPTGMAALAAYGRPQVGLFNVLNGLFSLVVLGAVIASQNSVATGMVQLPVAPAFGVGFARLLPAIPAVILSGLGTVLGLVLLLVPGIWLFGVWFLWPVALFAEHAGPMRSLGISYELVRGHWWRSSTTVTVAMIIALVFSMLAGLVSGLSIALLRGDLVSVMLATQVVGSIANVFVLPMVPAALVAIYQDLKLRRDGADLAARVQSLKTA